MSKETLQLVSIGIYLAGMLLIGWYAYRKTSNLTDYMLGERSWVPSKGGPFLFSYSTFCCFIPASPPYQSHFDNYFLNQSFD